jgi:hypothetical protein
MRMLISGLALLLAMTGQFAFRTTAEGLALGVSLQAAALLIFIGNSVSARPAQALASLVHPALSYQGVLIALAVVMTLVTAAMQIAFERFSQSNYLPVLVFWATSAGLYVAALSLGRTWRLDWRAWWQTYRGETIGLGLVTALGAALRFYELGAIPRVINGDEGLLGQAALLTERLPLANPFALFENFGALYLQSIYLTLQVFGQTAFALRLLPAIGGTLAVPALYLLGRWLFGPRAALFASALLAIAHAHIHFSRTVAVGYIQGTLLIPLELYFLISGLQKRSALRLALGGLILGMHFGVYLSAQIVTAFALVYLLVAAVLCRPLIQQAVRQIPAFWLGLGITGLPFAVHAWLKPEEFLARMNADGTFQSGWLTQRMAETGQSAAQILLERVGHAFLSLNFYPAGDFYGARSSVLDFWTSVLFILGLGYALWRTRDLRYLLLNGYFWSVTIAVGVFSVPPSADSYRMLIAVPAAILMAALGLEQLLNALVLALTEEHQAVARHVTAGFVFVAVLALNLRTYFYDFTEQCRYGGDPQTRFAAYLGRHLREYERITTVYLLSDDTFRYGTHSSVDFLSRNFPVTNWGDPASALTPGPGMAVVASPNRVNELREWAGAHPGGALSLEMDCQTMMLLAYELP